MLKQVYRTATNNLGFELPFKVPCGFKYVDKRKPKPYRCPSPFTIDAVVQDYSNWVHDEQRLIWHYFVKTPRGSVEKFAAGRCAKRGNDVYAYRVKKRFDELDTILTLNRRGSEKLNHFQGGLEVNKKMNTIFATLTYDIHRCSIQDAWANVGKEFNRFLSRIKYFFKTKIWIVFRSVEAFANGYPHIHTVLFFPEWSFQAGKLHKFINKKSGKPGYKLLTEDWMNDKFHAAWHSHIQVECIERVSKAMSYVSKYIGKSVCLTSPLPRDEGKGVGGFGGDNNTSQHSLETVGGTDHQIGGSRDRGYSPPSESEGHSKDVLTHAFQWMFRKRSFSISCKFKRWVFQKYIDVSTQLGFDLTKSLSTFQSERARSTTQVDLFGSRARGHGKELRLLRVARRFNSHPGWFFGITEKEALSLGLTKCAETLRGSPYTFQELCKIHPEKFKIYRKDHYIPALGSNIMHI